MYISKKNKVKKQIAIMSRSTKLQNITAKVTARSSNVTKISLKMKQYTLNIVQQCPKLIRSFLA